MKNARKQTFQLFTVLCSALLDSMTAAFYFFFLIRVSIMTAGKFKPVPSPSRGALV